VEQDEADCIRVSAEKDEKWLEAKREDIRNVVPSNQSSESKDLGQPDCVPRPFFNKLQAFPVVVATPKTPSLTTPSA
jgi:hypothetical protein